MEEFPTKGKKVGYFFSPQIGKYYYGKDHPMKPKRVAMAHSLITQLGLYKHLDVYAARSASDEEMTQFHTPEYIKYLGNYVSSNQEKLWEEIGYKTATKRKDCCMAAELTEEEKAFNIYDPKSQQLHKVGQITDCPGFDGLYNFCQISSGASIDAAHLIINQEADIAINWGGGLHHAKKQEASGFCYVNDIVLCILELLKFYPRVVYLDIDVHHGDGVEEAFFLTNRVMTVSFHQYGDDFFPGSGSLDSFGEGQGKYHSINVPLKPGITDDMYEQTFKRIMGRIIESFRPNVIVLQSGADSIAHDKLGQFNLSTVGRGRCVDFIVNSGIPVIQLGGGGYNVPNVARCWAYETSISLGKQNIVDTIIPNTDQYYDSYQPDHKLHVIPKSNLENKNTSNDINKIEQKVLDYLRSVESAPNVQFHNPPNLFQVDSDDEMEQENENYRDTDQYNNFTVDPEIEQKTKQKVQRAQNI